MNRDTGNVTEVVTNRSKEDETGHKITSYVIAGNPTEGLITLRHRDGSTEQMDAKDIMEVTSDETSASLREALADAVRQEAMNEYASAWTSAQLEQAQQGNMPTEQTQGEQTTQAESAPVEEATQATPSQEEQAQYSISADARYSQMDTQQAWEDILSKTEGDETMAQEVVAETIAEKKAELRALEEAPAPKGSNLEERIANKKQHKEQIAKAKAEIEHWEQIAGAKEHKTEIPVQQNTPSIKTTEQWQAEAKEHNTNLNAEEIATQTGVKASRIQKVIDWANKMGVKLNFEAYTTTGNAGTGQLTNAQVYADRREMTISKLMLSEGLDIAWVAGHELTHQVRENGTKQDWEAYKATIKTMLGEEAWNKGILQRAMLYRQAYKNMNDADFLDAMEEELCADVAGDIFTNTNNINKVLGIAQSWPQRLLNTIVDTLRNIFGNGAPRKYRDALSAWEKLAKEKAQAEGNGNITNAEPKHSIVGVKGATELDKAEGTTLRQDNLGVAKEMEVAGKNAETIWMATRWERGADGKWRYDIMDNIPEFVDNTAKKQLYEDLIEAKTKEYKAATNPVERHELRMKIGEYMDKSSEYNQYFVADILGEEHPLMQAYPDLGNITIKFNPNTENCAYYPLIEKIELGTKNEDARTNASNLAHELQHAIQHAEGFARGGSIKSVRTKGEALKQDVRPLYEMMLDTPEWAERERLLNRWFEETDKEEIAKIDRRVSEINESGVLDDIQAKRKELQDKYGMDATVRKILSGPYAEDAEIWEQLPDTFKDKYDAYYRLAGEVEARNASARQNMTPEERRQTRPSKSEDIAREEQIVKMDESGKNEMGSRTNKKRSDIENYFNGRQLSKEQQDVVDAFTGKRKGNVLNLVDNAGKGHHIQLKEGAEPKAGIVHSVAIHFNSRTNNYTEEEILMIPDIIKNGVQKRNGNKIAYEYEQNGITYTVTTEIENREEKFTNFFTNRKPAVKRGLNTANQHPTSSQPVSAGKGTTSSSNTQGNGNNTTKKFSIPNRNQEIFVSNAARAVESIKQEKATPEQWLAMIQKQGGLKAGEDKWLGLSEWLKGMDKKSVSKQEILDFINENMIRIEEVHYGENSSGGYEKLDEEILDLWREAAGNGYEKAEQVQNVLNDRYDGFADAAEIWYDGSLRVKDEGALAEILGEDNPINSTRLNYSTEGLENKQEIALTVPTIEPWNTSDEIHFGDAGGGRAVAWIRFGETTDAEGKEVLVIDEIQSKRHQEGREKGYRDADTKELLDAAVNAYRSATHEHDTYRAQLKEKYDYNSFGGSLYDKNVQFINSLTQEERANLDELISKQRKAAEALDKARDAQKAIPDAPFDKNWQELAMKRMLRYAAENGFDKVAWTTGEQQAERYDIGTVVKNIEVNAVADSETGEVLEDEFEVYTRSNTNGGGFIPEATGRMSTNQIKEVFGKDLGNKIIESGRSSDNTVIEGRGLRIGGEGMKGFYDKILPSFVNKYVKKWGAKVGEVTLPELEESAQHMWSVDVTPEMKESVMQGQVMFSISPDIMAANERFNEELDEYIQKGSKANFIFHVGQPLGVMKLFFPELPIVMRPRVINKASNTKHDVDVASLYNLPQYIAEPIFVFQREDGAIGILTEMTDNNGKNVCVAVELNKKIQDGGTYLDVNDIRSIHGRDVKNIVLPIIHNSTLKYADKEKALEWFSSASSIYQQEITSQELFDATKIIENFQNPPLPEDNSSQSPQNVTPTGQNKVNYSIYGGNKGYVGYSMSKRAANARAEGRFPKGDFKKEYNITDASLDMLTQAGVISNSEWHHTSMYGNKTYFYGWGEDGFAEHYAENKAEIDKQARQLSKSKPNIEEFEPTTEGMRLYDKANQEWKEQRDAVVNDWQDKFYEASEQWKQQEEEQKAKAHEEWLEQTEYNNYVRDLNVPAEFNASNGVRVVTNGSGLPAKWEYYWGENAAFKKYANAAREELEKHLKENKGEVPTFEEWKNQKGQTLFSISTPPRQANESIIDYAHRVAQDMEKKRKAQALGRGIADLEDDIELTTEHLRIIGDNEPHTIDEAAATALAGTKLLWEDYTDGEKEISA